MSHPNLQSHRKNDVSNVSDRPPPLPPKDSPTTEDHPKKIPIKPTRPNLVVPSLESTLPHVSYQARLSRGYDKFRYYFGLDQNVQSRSLLLKPTPAPIKNVLIIGVHGFFPTKVLRPILGEPTGTSLRFAQCGEKAVNSWSKENDLDVNIQKIALEREGKVFDRVDFFFDIMKSYEEDVKKADFIFVCAHSQGCPVSIMLMSKLIEHGVIAPHTKIGMLCMAGINNGPYNGIDQSLFVRAYSTIENESMLELFEFQKFNSLQSRKYLDSLRNLIINNVKVTYVGSIDDQMVPLYSATASHVKHPNIFKAVYIDGDSDTPDFVTRIVKLCCTLQNLGYSDHDVIKEISYALAGPLTGVI
ncbi:unnamed protein product [Ambrosiozyma monospora]|uniref:Unnamed protein product n=1 Tax=Ambrosiozyma monospora TaxID=43982 RepID=A0ACB5U3P3_AMBMO|nr:unnamed protein product [Ambrosiozyma monospora]